MFSSSSNLKQHKTIHQTQDERKQFICNICEKVYLYPSSLRKHQETDHDMAKEDSKDDSVKITIAVDNIEDLSKMVSHKSMKEESVKPGNICYILSYLTMFGPTYYDEAC